MFYFYYLTSRHFCLWTFQDIVGPYFFIVQSLESCVSWLCFWNDHMHKICLVFMHITFFVTAFLRKNTWEFFTMTRCSSFIVVILSYGVATPLPLSQLSTACAGRWSYGKGCSTRTCYAGRTGLEMKGVRIFGIYDYINHLFSSYIYVHNSYMIQVGYM